MASQYGEDKFILEFINGRQGRFLDVGAHDGVIFSNTWCLSDAGWPGILLEPSPYVFTYLVNNYEMAKKTAEYVNAALLPGVESGLIPWWDSKGDALSSAVEAHTQIFKGHPFQKFYIGAITWHDLLARFPGPYQFINIDAESLSYQLLASMPFSFVAADLICVELEMSSMQDALNVTKDVFRKNGYINFNHIGGNLLAWK